MRYDDHNSLSQGVMQSISGAGDIEYAFIPNPLPPEWVWPEELWPVLLEAVAAINRMQGAGQYLPNPDIIMRPLKNREALKSSSLEGTITDPQEQLLFNIFPAESLGRDDPNNAHREVYNYQKALDVRREMQDLPISFRLIRALHRVLMDGVRGDEGEPGEIRRLQNQIGRPARFVPPPVTELLGLLANLEKYIHQTSDLHPLVRAFIVHYQFETIHPFRDGNGRVGRLLLALTISEWCDLGEQTLYMSDYFDRNKDNYIDLLYAVSSRGNWADWIRFCLDGVVFQANDTLKRFERLISLSSQFREAIGVSSGSTRLVKIVDDLFINPLAKVPETAKRLGVTYPTAREDLKKLCQLGIVSDLHHKSNSKLYYCAPIFNLIYDDEISLL